jgi:hypothetical protein
MRECRSSITYASVIAAVALIATTATAAPKLSGKYAFTATTFCAATLQLFKGPSVSNVVRDGGGHVTSVTTQQVVLDGAPKQGGLISSNIGYITFNSPAAGQLTISGATLVEGAGFRVQGKSSFAWSSKPDNLSGVPYSVTATTFTFGSGEDAQVYQMVYADPLESNPLVYRTVYLMRRADNGDDANLNLDCVNNVQVTRQAD